MRVWVVSPADPHFMFILRTDFLFKGQLGCAVGVPFSLFPDLYCAGTRQDMRDRFEDSRLSNFITTVLLLPTVYEAQIRVSRVSGSSESPRSRLALTKEQLTAALLS